MGNYNVTGLISEFHHTYPNILLKVREVESINLLNELDEGNCDIAYIRLFELNSDKYEKITVGFDQFAAVLPQNHPLAKREMISLSELKDESFYQLDRNTQLLNSFYSACQKAGFQPNIGYTGTHIDNILDFVSNGVGISLMMQNFIKPLNYPGIVIIPIDIVVKSELAFIRSKCQKQSSPSNIFWKYIHHKTIPANHEPKG
jgi:LysR family transcriptional activator of glutamate synthase operon